MKLFRFFLLLAFFVSHQVVEAENISFGKGRLVLTFMTDRAVRIQYQEGDIASLPEWIYVQSSQGEVKPEIQKDGNVWSLATKCMNVKVDTERMTVTVCDADGKRVFLANEHSLSPTSADGVAPYAATLGFDSPQGEHIFGLGQFQDGYTNVRGLTRRLTQVNTQIAVPMMISDQGYGLLWNNYGMTEWNPADHQVKLAKSEATGGQEVVNVTSTEGGRQEVRQRNVFEAQIEVPVAGDYSLLLDVGQKMARRHQLSIDAGAVMDMQNVWLPPTASCITHLTAGTHKIQAELSRGDQPVLYYTPVRNRSVLSSPVAQQVDYTVFVGQADEVIQQYRRLTGEAPLMPQWALGYIHCRERFHSQDELLSTGKRFRAERLPVDVIVQDWQYWGKYGWNSMRFDEEFYPSPRQMTDSLHRMNMRLMVSVWSKIDKNSEVGKLMLQNDYYIPGTDWIDFFNPKAAGEYWKQFSTRLVPLGIDAWWQDATEPENDDLVGRRVMNGKYAGELFRNVYPLMVNMTVYEGLRNDRPDARPMILTRCGAPGIQRYGSALWSGDVGNDWETLRRQIAAGLGMQAAGIPWWTYDAGGFFRPGNQYQDKDYIERMLRWIETAVYLPLMRVHGYMSNTEPWNYGAEAQSIIEGCLRERYQLLPYIYSNAYQVANSGSTLMRPLLFDFPQDKTALDQRHSYMFGKALLVCPVTEPSVTSWKVYLPTNGAGWYDFRTGKYERGGQTLDVAVDNSRIPVFAKGGSIVVLGPQRQYTGEKSAEPYEVKVYPGADAYFELYEDEGDNENYRLGRYRLIAFQWDEQHRRLTVTPIHQQLDGMPKKQTFNVVLPGGETKTLVYKGKKASVTFAK